MTELRIPAKFDRGALRNEDASVRSAVWLLGYMCSILGIDDLSSTDVLDVGCGVKFSQAILNHDLPVGSYTGVDVYGEMIDFLEEQVTDPRFEYHHVNVRNELYNPDAPVMTAETDLGVGDRTFDLICLFSVFTHLAPDDYVTMLKLLRRHARADTRLIYTLFVNEFTEGGHGLADSLARILRENSGRTDTPDIAMMNAVRHSEPFVDADPRRPLMWPMYSRDYAYELIEGTGWTPLELRPPNEHAQHHFICAPVW